VSALKRGNKLFPFVTEFKILESVKTQIL